MKLVYFVLFCIVCSRTNAALVLNVNITASQNFDSLLFGKNLVGLDSGGWKIDNNGTAQFSNGETVVSQVHADNSTFGNGGTYNFGGASTDRAVGSMSAPIFASPRHLLLQMQNGSSSVIKRLGFAFDWERYRINTANANGTFFHSSDGNTWIAESAGNSGVYNTGGDAYGSPPGLAIDSINRNGTITGLSIAPGANYYFRWTFNTPGDNSQAIGVDNFSVIAAVPEPSSLVLLGLSLVGLTVRRKRAR